MLAFMEAHPQAGAAGVRLVRDDGSLDKACRRSFPTPEVAFYRLFGLSRLFPRSRRFGRYNLTYLSPDVTTEVDSVVGAFMLMRGEALAEVGLLDERYFMYAEDLDLCYRLKQRGWQVWYNADVTVLHYKGRSSQQRSALANYHFYRTMRLFHDKHFKQRTFFLVNWTDLRRHRAAGRLGVPPRPAAPGRAARRSLGHADQGRHRVAMKRKADLLFGLLLAISDLSHGHRGLLPGLLAAHHHRRPAAGQHRPIPGLCLDAVRPGDHH